jgi:phenylacetate-CoA ligase
MPSNEPRHHRYPPVQLVRSIALSVPAYRKLLNENGIDPNTIATMSDLQQLPTTSKESYRHANTLADLRAGSAHEVETISCSAGSTGSPTLWPRSERSTEHGAAMFGHILRECVDTEHHDTLALVTFPLGSYVGGTYMYSTLLELRRRGHKLSIATPGMDLSAARDLITEAAGQYQHLILFAYPPHARDLIDTYGDLLREHDVHLIVGGEPVSEAWRTRIHSMLGDDTDDRVRVVYGSTDVGFVGYETTSTIAIRSAAAYDQELDRIVFGAPRSDNGLVQQPAFVQYQPDYTYIEVDPDGYLLFTVGGVLPLIRYRVNDRGETLTGSSIRGRLEGAGYNDLARGIDPDGSYLLVHGRTDVAAIFNAVNIYPDYLRPAVEHISLSTRLTGRFVVRCRVDDVQHQTLELDAELRPNQNPDTDTITHLTQLTIASLRQMSAEYRIVHDQKGSAVEPVVHLKPFNSHGFVTTGKHKPIQ